MQTLDLDSGVYRPSTLADLHDFTRLQDTLDNVSWFARYCVATDVPDVCDLDINTAYALVRNTTKPVTTSFTLTETVAPIAEMLDVVAGGPDEFAKRPFLKAHISPVISPLRYVKTRWMWSMNASPTTSPCPVSPPHRPELRLRRP